MFKVYGPFHFFRLSVIYNVLAYNRLSASLLQPNRFKYVIQAQADYAVGFLWILYN